MAVPSFLPGGIGIGIGVIAVVMASYGLAIDDIPGGDLLGPGEETLNRIQELENQVDEQEITIAVLENEAINIGETLTNTEIEVNELDDALSSISGNANIMDTHIFEGGEFMELPPMSYDELLGIHNHQTLEHAEYELIPLHDFPALHHFGPFSHSAFRDIQTQICDTQTRWFYNDYFEKIDVESHQWYEKYLFTYDAYPFSNYINDYPTELQLLNENCMMLELLSVSYTQKYGGSVQLHFELIEDFFYEINLDLAQDDGTTIPALVDIGTLSLDVFVNPDPRSFNVHHFDDTVHVEFTPSDIVVYESIDLDSTSGTGTDLDLILTLDGDYTAEINDNLRTTAESISIVGAITQTNKDLPTHSALFILGFLHSAFNNTLGNSNFVDNIEISDDYIDIDWREGIPKLIIKYSIKVSQSFGDLFGDPEFIVVADISHDFYDNRPLLKIPTREYDKNSSESSYDGFVYHISEPRPAGVFTEFDCDLRTTMIRDTYFYLRLYEDDRLGDDYVGTAYVPYFPNWDKVYDDVCAENWNTVVETQEMKSVLKKKGGSLSITVTSTTGIS